MSQRWWLVGVAVVGVVLAVLLVPRPDTGADIPDPDPTNTDPLDFKAPAPAPAPAPTPTPATPEPQEDYGMRRTPPVKVEGEEPNITPEQKAFIEKRNAPEPTAARAMVGPMGSIRRQLSIDGSDEAKAMIAKIAPVQAELSDIGQNPDTTNDLGTVVSRMDSVIGDVKTSKWYADPIVKSSVQRYEAARDAWQAQ